MTQSPLDLAQMLVERALKAGADSADAIALGGQSRSVSWREGKLEDIDGSEGVDIGLRALIGTKQAVTSTSNLGAEALSALIDRTVDMAKAAPEDPYASLLGAGDIAQGLQPDLDIYDDTDPGLETLKSLAAEAEDAARAVPGVTNSDGAGASMGTRSVALVTSNGFAGSYQASSFSVSVSALAEQDGTMERDYDYTSARHFGDLEEAANIGRLAGEKAVKRLGGSPLKSGSMPVVFDPRVASSLLGHFTGAINGTAIARGSSFLQDAMDSAVFAPGIRIVDAALRPRGLRSRPFDGEGAAARDCALVEDGILQTWMLNAAAARQLGLPITGHGARGVGGVPGIGGANLYMDAGTVTPAELMADIKDGFYVTELIGMGVNGVTGDYSRGAAGFRIKDGALTTAVNEVTIAGNLRDMFKALTPADDLEFRYGTNAPTLRVDGMILAGR